MASPLFSPARLILHNDLRLIWRGFRAGRWRSLGSAGLIVLALLGAHGFAFLFMLPLHGTLPPLYIESVLWSIFGFLMLSAAMNHAISLLYERADFDLLLGSPVSPRAVLLARLASITIGALTSVAIFIVPLLNLAPFRISATYLWGWLVWLLLGVLTAAVGVGLTLSAVRWLGLRRARVTVQVLAALLGAVIFLATQVPRMLPARQGRAFYQQLLNVAHHPAFTVLGRAGRGEPLPLIGLVLATVGIATWATRRMAQTFIAGTQDASAITTRRRRTGAPYRWQEGLTRVTLRKDLRLIIRDPLLLAQVLPSAFYVIPALVGFGRGSGLATIAPLTVMLMGQFSLLLTAVAAAGEEGWDLIHMSPSPEIRLRVAKMLAGMSLPVALGALLCLALGVLGHPWLALATLVTATAIAAGCSWLQVTDIRPTPRKDILRKRGGRSIGRGLVSGFLILVGALGLGVVTRGYLLVGSALLGVAFLTVLGCFALVEIKAVNPRPEA